MCLFPLRLFHFQTMLKLFFDIYLDSQNWKSFICTLIKIYEVSSCLNNIEKLINLKWQYCSVYKCLTRKKISIESLWAYSKNKLYCLKWDNLQQLKQVRFSYTSLCNPVPLTLWLLLFCSFCIMFHYFILTYKVCIRMNFPNAMPLTMFCFIQDYH